MRGAAPDLGFSWKTSSPSGAYRAAHLADGRRAEAYGATKAAIRNLFAALHVSLQPLHISASVICPGFVETELTRQNDFEMPSLITSENASKEILKGIADRKQEVHFPKRFSLTLKFIASLPNPMLSWLVNKFVVRK